jgi:hypothetical protein
MRNSGQDNKITAIATSPSISQPTISLQRITPARREQLDYKAAMAIYMGAHAFRAFEEGYMSDFLVDLSGNAWNPPTRQRLAGELLDICYKRVETKVNTYLKPQETFHFIIDETTDQNSNRMINLSAIQKPLGSLFLANRDAKDAKLSAKFFLQWFLVESQRYTRGDTQRIGSMTSDTCATMRNFWALAEAEPSLSHVIFVPCDSHGLQLLIKDLLQTQPFQSTLSQAQNIARGFHKAKKQYSILRVYQESTYGRKQALILSVITRWGSQFGLLNSILKNKDALRLWATDIRAKGAFRESILDSHFWIDIENLAMAIKPIHEAIKLSERTDSTIGEVIPRWDKVKSELSNLIPFIPELSSFLRTTFFVRNTGNNQRYDRESQVQQWCEGRRYIFQKEYTRRDYCLLHSSLEKGGFLSPSCLMLLTSLISLRDADHKPYHSLGC